MLGMYNTYDLNFAPYGEKYNYQERIWVSFGYFRSEGSFQLLILVSPLVFAAWFIEVCWKISRSGPYEGEAKDHP